MKEGATPFLVITYALLSLLTATPVSSIVLCMDTTHSNDVKDFSHLDAIGSRLHRERVRLAEATNGRERQFRELQVQQAEKELKMEREFLGLEPETKMTDDELFEALQGDL